MSQQVFQSTVKLPPQLHAIDASHAHLVGDLTLMSVTPLVAQGEVLIKQVQGDTWQLDLAGVERVSSAAVALLLQWLRYATHAGKRIQLRHLPDEMRPIIAISDLETLFAELELVE